MRSLPQLLSLLFLLLPGPPPHAQPATTRPGIQALNADAYRIYTADFGRADSLFALASATARREGWTTEEAAARKNLGVVRFLTGEYDAALAEFQTALSLYEDLADDIGQASVLVEMGNFFKKRRETDRARSMLRRAARLARQGGDDRLYSNALDIDAMFDLDAGNLDVAERQFREVLALRRRIRDTVGLSYVYDHLASALANGGRTTEALTYLDSTIQIRRLLDDRQGMAIAINNQGETLLVARDTAGAIPYLERSLAMSRAVGFTDLQQWTLGLLSQAYASIGQPRRALALQRSVQTLKDSLYDVTTSARVAEMQERFESAEREAELAARSSQLARRTTYLIAALLAVVLLAGLLLYRAQHQRYRRAEERRLAEARLREDRLRISRDLHDHLGAELTVVAAQLNRLDAGLPGRPLRPVTEQVRYAMDQMRETIWAVRLQEATWPDLFARLRQFADKLPHKNIAFDLNNDLRASPLSPNTVLNLFRFAQEGLANAVKYAGAERISVTANPGELRIEDDGAGFDPDTPANGFGMHSLRERAAEVGGRMELDSSPGKGTTLRLIWTTLR